MPRRHSTTSTSPYPNLSHSSSHNPRHRDHYPHRSRTAPEIREKEKEHGFDWADGISIALVGLLTLIDHDNSKTRRRSLGDDNNKKPRRPSADERDTKTRRRSVDEHETKPSKSRKRVRFGLQDSDSESERGDVSERYYEYGPLPGSREKIRAK
ncbi:hypothetical protein B0T10DRAFT_211554 [Thelonectria olida]|uniref:Uncharacterized protein n=1 Tax=Thelonectria olida TaxID=1576542 RepID=A0A9P8WF21_9HYPO|nr:hypothetical protein B0T10DRAFT_211554 [Thelonectria olida]